MCVYAIERYGALCQTMFALDDEQITNYRRLFAAMDADGGGSLVSHHSPMAAPD